MAARKKKKAVKKAKVTKKKRVAKKAARRAPARKAAAKRGRKAAKTATKAARKTPVRKATKARKAAKARKTAKRGEYGEGNYKASKRFREQEEAFISANRSKIAAMGKAAEKALDGPEGEELRAAEAEAANHAAGEESE